MMNDIELQEIIDRDAIEHHTETFHSEFLDEVQCEADRHALLQEVIRLRQAQKKWDESAAKKDLLEHLRVQAAKSSDHGNFEYSATVKAAIEVLSRG